MTEQEKREYWKMTPEQRREYDRKRKEDYERFMETFNRDFWMERVTEMLKGTDNRQLYSIYHFLLHLR